VDEVTKRLQREGARIGDVTISLIWNDESDLDLHVHVPTPDGTKTEEIDYQHKKSACGGVELDVDMNASIASLSKEPVENVYAGDVARGMEAPHGTYKVQVENFAYHGEGATGAIEPREIEYCVQVRKNGEVTNYVGSVNHSKQRNDVCEFVYEGNTGGTAQTEMLQAQARQREADARQLRALPSDLLQRSTRLLSDGPLKETLTSEALLAVQAAKYRTWGKHFLVTLPQMLLAERRSNFRDLACQGFGRDAMGREGFFETLSNEAEMCFASLTPPEPSGLERMRKAAEVRAAAARNAEERERARAQAARTSYQHMPDEFMRGGGCFAPEATVICVDEEGRETVVPMSALRAGAQIRTASGGTATVRCVVQSACEDGHAVLTQMPNGLQLTEWHPLLDAHNQWRFPNMIGRRIVRACAAVFNLVLDCEHIALVSDVPCCTLGHGIRGPVVGHPFWGTGAILEQLATYDGWASGHVALSKPLRAPV